MSDILTMVDALERIYQHDEEMRNPTVLHHGRQDVAVPKIVAWIREATAREAAREQEVERLREALKFYADGRHIVPQRDGSTFIDDGSRARAALEAP